MRSLVAHGFLDTELNDRLDNICELIPHAREIARLGKEQKINGETWRFLDRSLAPAGGQYVGWHIGELYREGTYGKIHKAFRMVVQKRGDGLFDVKEAPHEVVVKQTMPPTGSRVLPAEDVTAHTSEALLHVLAWQAMQETATPWAIPRPYEVFGDYTTEDPGKGWRSMSLCMSYVRGRTLHSFLQKHWNPDTRRQNTRIFVEVLAQVAYILYHLQRRLQLNHRDVKVNNILVRPRAEPVLLEIGSDLFLTNYEVTLIDFGFACVGCPPPNVPMTLFQAGSWFPFGELCCKVGRDMAQLIFCIHCYFPLHEYLTPSMFAAVRSWMEIPWSGGVADALHGFTKEGRPRRTGAGGHPEYHTGIYEFLRRADVDPASCGPHTIFKECARLHLNDKASDTGKHEH